MTLFKRYLNGSIQISLDLRPFFVLLQMDGVPPVSIPISSDIGQGLTIPTLPLAYRCSHHPMTFCLRGFNVFSSSGFVR